MQEKIKDYIIAFVFPIIFIAFFVINMVTEDKLISTSERRKLAQAPNASVDNVLSGKFVNDLEKYTLDQFVFRDDFRKLKSFFNFKILLQSDNNGLFEKNNAIYKLEYPLKEKAVQSSADKIKYVYNNYLKNKDTNVYYTIVPDKNYYLDEKECLKIDYSKLGNIMHNNLKELEYIDIFDCLTLEDYYRTDLHWKQENLEKVINKIKQKMNLNLSDFNSYTVNEKSEFYGSYYGQIVSSLLPDKINVLTSSEIDNAGTYNVEKKSYGKVYLNKVLTDDKYDVFLEGATPIIEVYNPNIKTKKELIIFRDSFGSSLAPLFIENYSKITLVDLRYISSKMLGQYITFDNQDVIFMYSTLILNQNVLK